MNCAWCSRPLVDKPDIITLCGHCGEITHFDGCKLPDSRLNMLMQPEWRRLYLKWQQIQSKKKSQSFAT
jgi:hypothetical protein